MKKIIIAIAAVAAAFTMASCVKEQPFEPTVPPVVGEDIIIASTESSLTKTSLSGSDSEGYEVRWSEGDEITIGGSTFTLTEGANTTTGTFQGTLPEEDSTYTACYPASYNGTDWPVSQAYTANNITGSPMKAPVTVSGGKVSGMLQFTNAGGILRLTVKGSENILVTSITVSANGLEDITLNCGDGVSLDETNGTVFHIAMPEGSYSGTSIMLLAKGGKNCIKRLSSRDLEIERSKITPASFSANFTSTAPEGALPEAFTVSADGKAVFFSKGNLWCDTDANPAGANFHFEDNQYDTTPSTSTDRDNNHISHFLWCRSAADAVKTGYSETGNSADDILFTNAAGFTVNGLGNWYAPSHDEMDYLLMSRKASTVGGTANARYFSGRIDKGSGNYVNGLFVIPDVFAWPESELPNAPKGINQYRYNYSDNTYSVSEFASLQQAGVVFLPCAGSREGYSSGHSSVYYVNNSGYYWYSTLNGADKAGHLGFSVGGGVLEDNSNSRDKAYSIRLVTDSTPTFTVTFDMNGRGTAPAAITGVQYRSKVIRPMTPTASGYVFAGWYKDKGCTDEWDFDTDRVTTNTTLYAGWIELPEGALPGLFTVDANGKQVVFSQGNLYYGSIDYEIGYVSKGYHFETAQCISIPQESSFGQNILTRDKDHVSHFYWTTSYSYNGNTPYQQNFGEYKYAETDVLFTNKNYISFNGQTAWRSLTKEECDYLFNQRQMIDDTRVGYENCCDGINMYNRTYKGVFLYPDDYNGPLMGADGVPDRWVWSDISAAGIVFLPAGGYRDGNSVYNVGRNGDYFLNTPTPTSIIYSSYQSYAYELSFKSNSISVSPYMPRNHGGSIRLVMDISGSPAPTYTVTFNSNGHGTAPAELKKVPYCSSITRPTDPTADAATFCGWYKDSGCTEVWDFATDVVTSDITLYAKWSINDALPGVQCQRHQEGPLFQG